MTKVKHARTADCVVAGFRFHKDGPGTMIGSLLLGLYDDDGVLHHVGIRPVFRSKKRKQLVEELASLRDNALDGHPWRAWKLEEAQAAQRLPGATSRWNRGQGPVVEPLPHRARCARSRTTTCRATASARHAFSALAGPTSSPRNCRYDQLEERPGGRAGAGVRGRGQDARAGAGGRARARARARARGSIE